MPQSRTATTAAASWRALEWAGEAVYAVAALLCFVLTAAIGHVGPMAQPFEASDILFPAIVGAILLLPARFSHPVLRLAIGAMFLGYEASLVADVGLDRYVSSLGHPVFAKAEAARCILFCGAQVAGMLVTPAARAAVWAAARRRSAIVR